MFIDIHLYSILLLIIYLLIIFYFILFVYFLLHKKEMNMKITNGVCSSILFLSSMKLSFFRFFSVFSSFSFWWCSTRCSFMAFCVLKNILFSQDWKNIIGRVSNSIEQCRMYWKLSEASIREYFLLVHWQHVEKMLNSKNSIIFRSNEKMCYSIQRELLDKIPDKFW